MILHGQATAGLAVLFDRIGPYHHARLEAAAAIGDVVAVEFSAVDRLYAWDKVSQSGSYDRRTLFTDRHGSSLSAAMVRERLECVLADCRLRAVAIPGWGTRGALSALNWCLANGIPAVVLSDSWDPDGRRPRWSEAIKRRIVRLYGSALVAGGPQRDYLERLGMPRERIFTGYDAVDNAHFAAGADRARRNGVALRQQLKLPHHYFLAICRFSPEKNLQRLLAAYAAYRSVTSGEPWHLVLVGDGPLREELLRLRHQWDLQASVHVVRFQQYDQLPAYYGLAEALVLPSTSETWGLVVNEAMASGLPVLVSNRCGCAKDLVREGCNGYSFDPRDPGAIRDAMVRLSGSRRDLQAMGDHSRELIRGWSVASFAQGLWQASQVAWERPRPPADRLSRLALAAATRR